LDVVLGKLWTCLIPEQYLIYAAQGFYYREANTPTIQNRKVFEMEEIFITTYCQDKYIRAICRHDVVYKGLEPMCNNITIISFLGYVDKTTKPFPTIKELTSTTLDDNAPPPILTALIPRAKEFSELNLPPVPEKRVFTKQVSTEQQQQTSNTSFGYEVIDLEKVLKKPEVKISAPAAPTINISREPMIFKSVSSNESKCFKDKLPYGSRNQLNCNEFLNLSQPNYTERFDIPLIQNQIDIPIYQTIIDPNYPNININPLINNRGPYNCKNNNAYTNEIPINAINTTEAQDDLLNPEDMYNINELWDLMNPELSSSVNL